MSNDGGEDGDDGEVKLDYVKKEFVARAYECTSGMLDEVEASIVKDQRPKLRMRLSKPRREFCLDGPTFIDKESSDFFTDLKSQKQQNVVLVKKKILDIGLQAAHEMKRIQTQTYFGRSVNKST